MRRKLLLLVVVAALVTVPLARGDGDPASDFLIAQQTFVPPDDGIPSAYATQLGATVREAKARGYAVKVALIGSRYDMGSVTVLWRQPKQYARFLGTELTPFYKGKLLVVMPNGLAVSQRGKLLAHETAVASRVAPPGTDGKALGAAGTLGVTKLAADAGIVFPTPPLGSGSGGTAGLTTLEWVGIVAAAVLAGALVFVVGLWHRKRRAA